MSLKNWSTTAASNSSTPPNGAPESTTKIADFNNICRQIMADVRTLAASDTIASATTTDIGSKDSTFLSVTGTTTITGLGTVSAGIWKVLIFADALTFTHNGTSLILPGSANITTAAGDVAVMLSLGSGNWRCIVYQKKSGYAVVTDAVDATITAFASWANGTNKIPYTTSTDTFASLDFKDEDNMVSDSATAVPSQQSVKAYADTKAAASHAHAASDVTSGTIATARLGSGSASSSTYLRGDQTWSSIASAWGLIESWTPTATTNHVFDLVEDIYSEWILECENLVHASTTTLLTIAAGYSNGTLFDAYTNISDSVITTLAASSSFNGSIKIVGANNGATSHGLIVQPLMFQNVSGTITLFTTIGYSGNTITKRTYDSIKVALGVGNFAATGAIRLFGLKRAGA